MAFNHDPDCGVLLEEIGIGLQCSLLVCADIVLVVIEVDIFHALREHLFLAQRGLRRRRRRRLADGYPRRGRLGSSRTLGGEPIRGRVRRSHLLRSAGLHRANRVNADVRRVAGLPCQRSRLAFLYRIGVSGQRCRRCGRRRWWGRRRGRHFLFASAQHNDSAQREYEHDPLQFLLLHLLSSLSNRASLPGNARLLPVLDGVTFPSLP